MVGALFAVALLFTPVAAMAAAGGQIVCITCHGTLPGKFGEPVKLWQGSIHAENGIACNGCHGGDPADAANAMSPARGFLGAPKELDIPAFCGRCHVGVEKDYRASAHGRALGRGGPTCVTCHGNHRVVKASLELINEKSCSRCHSFERARLIREAMRETEGLIAAIDGKIAAFHRRGVDTDKLEKGLFALRNSYRSLFHNVDVELVRKESARIQGELQGLDKAVQGLDDAQRMRKLAGAAAVAGALLAALLFHLLKKSYD
ncbi:MAG TPA: cytochrome c3 family protein [Geobacteraceae bacterium]|nr:cytochrome c3 family protein [Geobacteraceae bacterium]